MVDGQIGHPGVFVVCRVDQDLHIEPETVIVPIREVQAVIVWVMSNSTKPVNFANVTNQVTSFCNVGVISRKGVKALFLNTFGD